MRIKLISWIGILTLAILAMVPARAEIEATFNVNAFNDAVDKTPGDGLCATSTGICTLRAAIQEANANPGADTILLPAGTYGLTIAGANEDGAKTGDLDIIASVTISGAGAAITLLNADVMSDRVFEIFADAGKVSINGVTLRRGEALTGGGLSNAGQLLLTNSILEQNQATQLGGGIYNTGILTTTTITLLENNATQDGGGIMNAISGTLHLEDTNFNSNVSGSFGGGVANTANYHITLNNCFFDENRASNGSGAIFNPGILAIHASALEDYSALDGSGLYNSGQAMLDAITMRNNEADSEGGGIYNTTGGKVQLEDSYFNRNSATANGGAILNGGAITLTLTNLASNIATLGGGIYNYGELVVVNSAIGTNIAIEQGGGVMNLSILKMENTTLSNDTAGGSGGGAYTSGTMALYNVSIAYNFAGSAGQGGNGGGIFKVGGEVTLRNTLVGRNTRRAGPVTAPDDCSGTFSSDGYNLLQTLDGCTLNGGSGTDLLGLDPQVFTLGQAGGSTPTNAFHPGSPGIDAANPAGCLGMTGQLLLFDQREAFRPVDSNQDGEARCDIGAFEYSPVYFLPLVARN